MSSQPSEGVHLLGSIRLANEPADPLLQPPSPADVFQALTAALPGRLSRIPDGETGLRHYFSLWQEPVFQRSPWILNERELAGKGLTIPPPEEQKHIVLGKPGYDSVAIASYAAFSKLKQQGVISAGTRFQVCIPTPVNIVMRYTKLEFCPEVERLYAAALLEEVRNIVASIPAHDLAIQYDLPIEMAVIEKVGGFFVPWFDPTVQCLADRAEPFLTAVPGEVELGFHLCYGDIGHQHFKQPADTANMVAMANALLGKCKRPVSWIHIPVPIDRTDDLYFHALRDLKKGPDTVLFLGLVHAHDLEGTRKRIDVAQRTVPKFGVATECGWGRTPVADIASILSILTAVTTPVN